MSCSQCGRETDSEDAFCRGCGTALYRGGPQALGVRQVRPLLRINPWVVLCIWLCTAGTYSWIWLLHERESINGLVSNRKIGSAVLVVMIVVLPLAFLLGLGAAFGADASETIAAPLGFIVGVVMLAQLLKVRRIIQDHTGRRVSVLGTVFLGVVYLQYKINRVIDSELYERRTIAA